MSPADWDASVADVMTAIRAAEDQVTRQSQPVPFSFMRVERGVPKTFFFTTREGGKGVLQVVGFTDNPPGMKIRYKLASTPGRPVIAAAAQQAPPGRAPRLQFRLVAGDLDEPSREPLPNPRDPPGAEPLRVLTEVLLDESAVASATMTNSPTGHPQIAVQFNADGARRFAAITGANVGRRLAIVFDGRVLSAPVIRDRITGDKVVITDALTPAEAWAMAQVLNAGAPAPGFGPVTDKLLHDIDDADGSQLLDFETGRIFALPTGFDAWQADRQLDWVTEHGIDLLVDRTDTHLAVGGYDFVAARMADPSWEQITPRDLLTRLASDDPQLVTIRQGRAQSYLLDAGGAAGTVLAFRTHEGGIGVLQIAGLIDNPRGVKIRYRLVSGGAPAPNREPN